MASLNHWTPIFLINFWLEIKSCPIITTIHGSLGFGCTQKNLHKFKKNVGCYTHTSKKQPTLTSTKQMSCKINLVDCVNKLLQIVLNLVCTRT
jgi:YHS domain-containing protein